jgi:hypothetical protein
MSAVIATIGHNNPPEPTPFEQSREEIDGLFLEASNWLDGEGVNSQEDADAVSKILDMIRQAVRRADERRIAENKPFDDGKAEVQARYNALIQDNKSGKGRAILAAETCKAALAPYLMKVEAEKRAKAEVARKEADAKAATALEAMRASRATDLAERERAEGLLREARAAEVAATRAENDKASAKGGARAVTLRTRYRAEVTDGREYARFVWSEQHGELLTFLEALAQRQVDAGRRTLPGVTVHEERQPV